MTSTLRSVLVLALLGVAAAASAAPGTDVRTGTLTISDAWTRPTAAGMSMGVAYFVVRNDGDQPDVLLAASTPAAARVEFHRTTFADGMARMRPLAEIVVPAHGRILVEPNGIHLMLVDLARPLAAGTRVPLVLEFRRAGRVSVSLIVESRGS